MNKPGELAQGQSDDRNHVVRAFEIGDIVEFDGQPGTEYEVIGILAVGVAGPTQVHLRHGQYTDHERHLYEVDVALLKRIGG